MRGSAPRKDPGGGRGGGDLGHQPRILPPTSLHRSVQKPSPTLSCVYSQNYLWVLFRTVPGNADRWSAFTLLAALAPLIPPNVGRFEKPWLFVGAFPLPHHDALPELVRSPPWRPPDSPRNETRCTAARRDAGISAKSRAGEAASGQTGTTGRNRSELRFFQADAA
jgi:hypothetical protein